MEKPDADGYVYVKWPSRNIPHGGVFHTKITEPSIERQNFLKVLLEESKLSIAQRRKDSWKLREENEPRQKSSRSRQMPNTYIRPRTSRRRSLSEIRVSGVLDMDQYRPITRGEDREKMKQKLQEIMAWGEDDPNAKQQPKLTQVQPPGKVLPTDKEIKNELLTQIRERVEWLADMEVLGEGARHRDIIQQQILDRMRNLEALGLVSECSSVVDSGFSTRRSTARSGQKSPGKPKETGQIKSPSAQSKVSVKKSPKPLKGKEENVLQYGTTELKYSPRRKC